MSLYTIGRVGAASVAFHGVKKCNAAHMVDMRCRPPRMAGGCALLPSFRPYILSLASPKIGCASEKERKALFFSSFLSPCTSLASPKTGFALALHIFGFAQDRLCSRLSHLWLRPRQALLSPFASLASPKIGCGSAKPRKNELFLGFALAFRYLCQKSVRHAGGRAAATAVRAEFAAKQMLL